MEPLSAAARSAGGWRSTDGHAETTGALSMLVTVLIEGHPIEAFHRILDEPYLRRPPQAHPRAEPARP